MVEQVTTAHDNHKGNNLARIVDVEHVLEIIKTAHSAVDKYLNRKGGQMREKPIFLGTEFLAAFSAVLLPNLF